VCGEKEQKLIWPLLKQKEKVGSPLENIMRVYPQSHVEPSSIPR